MYPSDFDQLLIDKYTAAELVELCDLSVEDLLSEVDFWQHREKIFEDLGIESDDEETDS